MTDRSNDADVRTLLKRAQATALNLEEPISHALRLCLLAGKKLDSPELAEWAKNELEGYPSDITLPPYRELPAQLKMDYLNGSLLARDQTVDASLIEPDILPLLQTVPMRGSVAELEAHVRTGEDTLRIHHSISGSLKTMIRGRAKNSEFLSISDVYWVLSVAQVEAALGSVRTRVLEITEDLGVAVETEMGDPQAVVQQHLLTVSAGDSSPVTINSASGSSNAQQQLQAASQPPRFWETAWWTVGKAIVGSIMLVLAATTAYFAYLAI